MPTLASTTPIVSHSAPTPASPPRKLCDGQLGQPGRKLPTTKFTPVGHPTLSDKLPASNGRWTWINFFAAWCGPCKEEMPRLREMEKKLSSNLVVAFVSVDDDQRQLDQFLETQGATGVRAALWVEPNKQRDTWLTGLKMKNPPDLPAHVLVDPSGKIRCVTGGAIEDADFAAISAIVKM